MTAAAPTDAARASISRHPAFPAIVATWFATLLGVGSLVLPASLLERAVEATGIAAPPLGFAARGVIALLAATIGTVAGLAIARRMARPTDDLEPDSGFAPRVRRPISVSEDLGGISLAEGMGLLVAKTRVRPVSGEDRASAPHEMAPLVRDDDPDQREAALQPAIAPTSSDRSEPLPFSAPSLARRAVAERAPEPTLAEPGGNLAQLVQRLEASIEHRRGTHARAAPAPAERAPVPVALPLAQRDTDAALREALATLRRMSGTA